ncbi:MAG: leucine-rich repeat protein, partial [Clostridia bacterium]|nr:leucine-rich repeat protein [Clostridia bacterium]
TKSSNEFGVELDFIEQLYEIASKTRGVEVKPGEDLNFKYVLITGVGASTSYTAAVKRLLDHDSAVKEGFDGTIALVKRGDTTFADKVQQAMAGGADACVIYNNVAGTIRMSLGEVENPIPTCSITMDAAVPFVNEANAQGPNKFGIIVINTNMVAGPFMSDFSSWGPMPDLQLKPEITAHGGEITSAVPGGYDQYSGTSMAAPNMAGAVAILRQYLQSEYKLEGTALNARINQVLMSTATIANNDSGDPYSPRKQGAGLAGIADAINTEGYITVLDGNDHGEVRDRTKIELYDDPQKKGEYVLNFTIHNLKNTKQTYKPLVHVMTETMSSDNKTVAEKAYMLTDNCTIEYLVGQDMNSLSAFTGDVVTVEANSDLTVRVKITLNSAARQYLDKNFVNGMYVEGFVSMVATGDTKVTIGLPYLAFYGDWTAAPLFDYDIYELAESDKDTNTRPEKKLKASAAETRILGMYEDGKYIFPLGQYIYNQNEEDVKLYAEREKIAVSMYDQPGNRTIYELYMVYAGLLRGAAYMDIQITDAATGDVVFEQRKENISKSYAAGGSNRGAIIRLELQPEKWNLSNNSTYNVSLKGEIDYNKTKDEDGVEHGAIAGGNRNTFDFQFTVDYEEPQMMGYRIRYVPYTENKVTKYKIWMDVDVYDNQFVETVLPCYLDTKNSGESVLRLVTEYPVPVYGQKGEVSTVSFEVTDIYDEYVKTGKLYIEVEDYAVNSVMYQLRPGNDFFGASIKEYPDSVDFVTDSSLTKTSETPIEDTNGPKGNLYNRYSLTLAPFTLYKLNTLITPSTALIQGLTWRGSNDRVKAQANEIYAGQSGKAELTLVDEFGNIYAAVSVRIAGAASGSAPTVQNIKFNAVLNGSGYATNLDSSLSVPELKLNPEQKDVQLTWSVTPWYCNNPVVKWESSNENIVKVDDYGRITAIKKGTAYVKLSVVGNDRISKEVKIIVGDEYRIVSYTLYDYYGSGEVVIPEDRNIMYLDEDCFKGDKSITKVVLPTTLTEIPENAFKGCTGLKEIVIPGQCTTIKESAFEGCTALTTVVFGKFVDANHNQIGDKFEDKYFGTVTLGRNAFKGCTALTTIENARRLTTVNEGAFTGCTALTEIDLTEVRVVERDVFAGCTKLATVKTSAATQIGEHMFEGCTALESFTFQGDAIAAYAFNDCTKLASFTIVNPISSIGEGAFTNTAISNITLPDGKVAIAADAFADCAKLAKVTLSANTELVINNRTPFTGCNEFTAYAAENSNYYTVVDGALFSKDGKTIVAVPYAKTAISLDGITAIGEGAFAGLKSITEIDASGVTSIGEYAFANSSVTSVKLPSGLTAIPNGLFDGCRELTSVTADDNFAGVTSVGANAFRSCAALEKIILENATEIGAHAFAFGGLKTLPSN